MKKMGRLLLIALLVICMTSNVWAKERIEGSDNISGAKRISTEKSYTFWSWCWYDSTTDKYDLYSSVGNPLSLGKECRYYKIKIEKNGLYNFSAACEDGGGYVVLKDKNYTPIVEEEIMRNWTPHNTSKNVVLKKGTYYIGIMPEGYSNPFKGKLKLSEVKLSMRKGQSKKVSIANLNGKSCVIKPKSKILQVTKDKIKATKKGSSTANIVVGNTKYPVKVMVN